MSRMEKDIVNEFVEMVSSKNEFQSKYLMNLEITDKEREELASVLGFLQQILDKPLEYLVEAYLFVNQMITEERYYFVKHGKYRNTTFAEVNRQVYQNQEYMTRYMTGLTIFDNILPQYIENIRYFERFITKIEKQKYYLEIGPGFGQFLLRAINSRKWDEYLAVDVSLTSVKRCQQFLNYSGVKEEKISIINQDFFQFNMHRTFDCVVCCEVLEHIEEPLQMLKKICDLLSEKGTAFVTTVINTPTIDHIYWFASVQEVLELVKKAGFEVEDYFCATIGNMSLEKAEKRKLPVNIALLLKKG